MIKSCLLCGVGGQGTVLASNLIAAAAMEKGVDVKTAETIGMAQRGGCVVSHVRTGENIHSPLVPLGEADVVISFEPAEAIRCLPYLKNGGTMVVSSKAVMPVTASLNATQYKSEDMLDYLKTKVEKLIVVNTDELVEKLGSAKPLNVALLGAAVRNADLGVSAEDIENVMKKMVKPQFIELNTKALYSVNG